MSTETTKQTNDYLRRFTEREDGLLEIVKIRKLVLPERLTYWRRWIGDPQIYLNELKNFIEGETGETLHKPIKPAKFVSQFAAALLRAGYV